MPIAKLPSSPPAPAWDSALQEFLLVKQAEGRAPRTIKDYQKHVTAFFSEHAEAWPEYHALRQAVRSHFAGLAQKSPTTYNLRREYLKAFFAWCVSEGYLAGNPAQGVPKRKNEGQPRDVGQDAIQKLLRLPDRSTYTGIRDYALILLQLDTGIRPGEALSLSPSCVNLNMLEVCVPAQAAKTRTARTVVISPQTARAIKKLLSVRPPEWGEDVPLFASQDGRRMLETSWASRLKKYSRKLGITVTPYMLRHTAAIMSLRNGGSAFFVQKQLGHTTLAMTRRYVHMVEADLHREHASCSPVAAILPERTRAKRKVRK